MITQRLEKPIKHSSEKTIVRKLYQKYDEHIHSLINQTGNLFDLVLGEAADFDEVAGFVRSFAEKQMIDFTDQDVFINGDGFSAIWITQVGNERREIISINAKSFSQKIAIDGAARMYTFFRIRGEDEVSVYRDFMYMEVLRKRQGKWHMYLFADIAEKLGEAVEKSNLFD